MSLHENNVSVDHQHNSLFNFDPQTKSKQFTSRTQKSFIVYSDSRPEKQIIFDSHSSTNSISTPTLKSSTFYLPTQKRSNMFGELKHKSISTTHTTMSSTSIRRLHPRNFSHPNLNQVNRNSHLKPSHVRNADLKQVDFDQLLLKTS